MSNHEHDSRFKQWLEDFQPILLKTARAYAVSRDDQDDLIQEMLFQLWRSIPSFRDNAKPSTWIYRVALNTALVWKRSESRRRRTQHWLTDADNLPDHRDDGQDAAENRAAVERLYAAIRTLPAVDRSLVLLHLDGLTYREMSDVLGITEGNAGVRLHRAKKQLLELLG